MSKWKGAERLRIAALCHTEIVYTRTYSIGLDWKDIYRYSLPIIMIAIHEGKKLGERVVRLKDIILFLQALMYVSIAMTVIISVRVRCVLISYRLYN